MLNACIICHKRKVIYHMARGGLPLMTTGLQYTNSPPPSGKRARPDGSDVSITGFTLGAATKDKQHDLVRTYRGRDRYLGRNVSFDEAMIAPTAANDNVVFSAADQQLLKDQGALSLPPGHIQNELVATFMEFGYFWTPVIDPAWLSGPKPAYLLQSIFVAASRLTTQPNKYGSTADFYRKAKLLFFFGNERNPLISIVSAILLHWYNPVGPETVSTDTSGFWLRAAESIAFQIGLHKEPPMTDPQRGLPGKLIVLGS
ncbi:hypothetical protein BJX63DRAFT_321288 [Aspergillus granulosus]|uniref:Transcription factor domain-containing protein n=1 Tax=Aspergillus granulosus TaxID=176169 RepID=A0ABR4H4H9_9EURO